MIQATGRGAHEEDLAVRSVDAGLPAHARDAWAIGAPDTQSSVRRQGLLSRADPCDGNGAQEAFNAVRPLLNDHGATFPG